MASRRSSAAPMMQISALASPSSSSSPSAVGLETTTTTTTSTTESKLDKPQATNMLRHTLDGYLDDSSVLVDKNEPSALFGTYDGICVWRGALSQPHPASSTNNYNYTNYTPSGTTNFNHNHMDIVHVLVAEVGYIPKGVKVGQGPWWDTIALMMAATLAAKRRGIDSLMRVYGACEHLEKYQDIYPSSTTTQLSSSTSASSATAPTAYTGKRTLRIVMEVADGTVDRLSFQLEKVTTTTSTSMTSSSVNTANNTNSATQHHHHHHHNNNSMRNINQQSLVPATTTTTSSSSLLGHIPGTQVTPISLVNSLHMPQRVLCLRQVAEALCCLQYDVRRPPSLDSSISSSLLRHRRTAAAAAVAAGYIHAQFHELSRTSGSIPSSSSSSSSSSGNYSTGTANNSNSSGSNKNNNNSRRSSLPSAISGVGSSVVLNGEPASNGGGVGVGGGRRRTNSLSVGSSLSLSSSADGSSLTVVNANSLSMGRGLAGLLPQNTATTNYNLNTSSNSATMGGRLASSLPHHLQQQQQQQRRRSSYSDSSSSYDLNVSSHHQNYSHQHHHQHSSNNDQYHQHHSTRMNELESISSASPTAEHLPLVHGHVSPQFVFFDMHDVSNYRFKLGFYLVHAIRNQLVGATKKQEEEREEKDKVKQQQETSSRNSAATTTTTIAATTTTSTTMTTPLWKRPSFATSRPAHVLLHFHDPVPMCPAESWYASREVGSGHVNPTTEDDVFSVGVLGWALVQAIPAGKSSVREFGPRVPEKVANILQSCLHVEGDMRPMMVELFSQLSDQAEDLTTSSLVAKVSSLTSSRFNATISNYNNNNNNNNNKSNGSVSNTTTITPVNLHRGIPLPSNSGSNNTATTTTSSSSSSSTNSGISASHHDPLFVTSPSSSASAASALTCTSPASNSAAYDDSSAIPSLSSSASSFSPFHGIGASKLTGGQQMQQQQQQQKPVFQLLRRHSSAQLLSMMMNINSNNNANTNNNSIVIQQQSNTLTSAIKITSELIYQNNNDNNEVRSSSSSSSSSNSNNGNNTATVNPPTTTASSSLQRMARSGSFLGRQGLGLMSSSLSSQTTQQQMMTSSPSPLLQQPLQHHSQLHAHFGPSSSSSSSYTTSAVPLLPPSSSFSSSSSRYPTNSITDQMALLTNNTIVWPAVSRAQRTFDSAEIDICLLIDATGGQRPWISALREAGRALLSAPLRGNKPRVAFVGYTDVDYPSHNRTGCPELTVDFTSDANLLRSTMDHTLCIGGQDVAEDVAGGLDVVVNSLSWRAKYRVVVHVASAPAHGHKYSNTVSSIHATGADDYPRGDPYGRDPEKYVAKLASAGVEYILILVEGGCGASVPGYSGVEAMCEYFRTAFDGNRSTKLLQRGGNGGGGSSGSGFNSAPCSPMTAITVRSDGASSIAEVIVQQVRSVVAAAAAANAAKVIF